MPTEPSSRSARGKSRRASAAPDVSAAPDASVLAVDEPAPAEAPDSPGARDASVLAVDVSAAAEAPDHEIPRYDDLRYRDVFWAAREYEDRCDRIAIRALLPHEGRRVVEVGAGYGRLAEEYRDYGEIVLLDASEAHVEAARVQFRDDPQVRVEQGDAYALPFDDASFDAVVCVRVVHHLQHPGAVFAEFSRILRPGGVLVLEFANKRNLKSILKYGLRRQAWSPFAIEPHEYLPLHFDRHPLDVRRMLRRVGLRVEETRAVSLFRLPILRGRIPAAWLAAAERPLQAPLGAVTPGPSVYVLARKVG